MQDDSQNTGKSVGEVLVSTPEQSISGITNAQLKEILRHRAEAERVFGQIRESGMLKQLQETQRIYSEHVSRVIESFNKLRREVRLDLTPFHSALKETVNLMTAPYAKTIQELGQEISRAATSFHQVFRAEAASIAAKLSEMARPWQEFARIVAENREASEALNQVDLFIVPSMGKRLLSKVVALH